MASSEPADLDLQCFQKMITPGSAGQGYMDQPMTNYTYHIYTHSIGPDEENF